MSSVLYLLITLVCVFSSLSYASVDRGVINVTPDGDLQIASAFGRDVFLQGESVALLFETIDQLKTTVAQQANMIAALNLAVQSLTYPSTTTTTTTTTIPATSTTSTTKTTTTTTVATAAPLVDLSVTSSTPTITNALVTSASFPNLTTITGKLAISSNSYLSIASFPVLVNITGGVVVSSNDALTNLSMPLLTGLSGESCEFNDNPMLKYLEISALTVFGCISTSIFSNKNLLVFSMNSLQAPVSMPEPKTSFMSISVTFNQALLAISFQQLKSFNRISIGGNDNLTIVSMPQLTHLGGRLYFSGNDRLQKIDFPALLTCGGVDVRQNNNITLVSFSLLQTLVGSLSVHSNAALTYISFPKLVSVSTDVIIQSNSLLTSISLPQLATVGGKLVICANPLLPAIPSNLVSGGSTVVQSCREICHSCVVCPGVCV